MEADVRSNHSSMEKWIQSLEQHIKDFESVGGELDADQKRKLLFDNVGPDYEIYIDTWNANIAMGMNITFDAASSALCTAELNRKIQREKHSNGNGKPPGKVK